LYKYDMQDLKKRNRKNAPALAALGKKPQPHALKLCPRAQPTFIHTLRIRWSMKLVIRRTIVEKKKKKKTRLRSPLSAMSRRPYARRMGQPTQRATNYTARSNIDTAQTFLHVNGQRPNRAMIRQRSRRRWRRGEPHTEHGLGVLLAPTANGQIAP